MLTKKSPSQTPPQPIELSGPMPALVGGMIYEVTLPSGMVVTNPDGFGASDGVTYPVPLAADDGTVLTFI